MVVVIGAFLDPGSSAISRSQWTAALLSPGSDFDPISPLAPALDRFGPSALVDRAGSDLGVGVYILFRWVHHLTSIDLDVMGLQGISPAFTSDARALKCGLLTRTFVQVRVGRWKG
jgi:hypothetical protein